MPINKREKLWFTDKLAMSLPTEGKSYAVGDAAQEYLFLRVHPTGARAWYFRRHWMPEGATRKYENRSIGDCFEVGVNQARDIVQRILQAAKMGTSPKRFLQQLVWSSSTVRAVVKDYIENRLKPRCTARYTGDIERGYERHMAPLLDMPVTAVTMSDVETWMHQVAAATGRATANKYFTVLHAAFNYAEARGHIELKRLPTAHVEKYRERERQSYLRPDQYPAFASALAAEPNQDHADIIRVLLFTGVRMRTAFAMRWQDIDFTALQWNPPKSQTNKRNPDFVALTDDIRDVLERRKLQAEPDAVWVFPAESKSGHVGDIRKVFTRVRDAAGLSPDFVIHSLRHTFCSLLAQAGGNANMIAAAAGHSSARTTERYVKSCSEAVRGVTQSGMNRLTQFAPKKENVLMLRRRTVTPQEPIATMETATSAAPAMNRPSNVKTSKNAGVRIGSTDQLIIEGKILSSLRVPGRNTKKAFYQKIGAGFQVNSEEMERILTEMEERGLIYKARRIPGQAAHEYAIKEKLQQA